MENITDLYVAAYKQIVAIREQTQLLQQQKQRIQTQNKNDINQIAVSFSHKRTQLEDERNTAETYLNNAGGYCGNVFPKQPDFGYMQKLFFEIDDQNPQDPKRSELSAVAAAAVKYLEQQLKQLTDEERAAVQKAQNNTAAVTFQHQDRQIRKWYDDFFRSPVFNQLVAEIKNQSDAFYISKKETYDLLIPRTSTQMLKFCMVHRPFPIPDEYQNHLQAAFGIYYDPKTKTVRLPFGFRTDKAVKIVVNHTEAMTHRVQDILIGILFNILRHYSPLRQRVVYIDPLTYNAEHLGVMKYFVGENGLIDHPNSDDAVIRALDRLIAAGSGSQRENRILIVRGYLGSLSIKAREKIRSICSNSAQYHVSVVLSRSLDSIKAYRDIQDETALSGALNICTDDQFFYMVNDGKKNRLSMFQSPCSVTRDMVVRFQKAFAPQLLGCEYPKRINLRQQPNYVKGNKRITLPFGVDTQDQLVQLDLNDTNFAMYLMGAAGSGKSTLLHTIITGIIHNYHPDDVELWLADFKMGEFSQYIDPMPPHVKYILMDESAEMVYDFVELLTQEMFRRKRFFAAHPQLKKIENVPITEYMPVIVVVIDEFSLMSQVVEQSTKGHKELLANLLTEGRALGFKFIFSSQEYTKGIQGLSGAAKDQVQTRIAMKNTADEIRQTLDIPGSTMTEETRRWIDTLPPHVALYKHYSIKQQHTVLDRAQVLYFPGNAEAAYAPQRALIDTLRRTMKPVPRNDYRAIDNSSYVDKNPVVADGTDSQIFSPQKLMSAIAAHKSTSNSYGDEVFFQPGSPRRLVQNKLELLVNEPRENILLMTGADIPCSMSVILSIIKAFAIQKGAVEIWAYRRNRLYQTYRNSYFSKCKVFDSPETIGESILRLKEKLQRRQEGRCLIILLGMAHILDEFAFMEENIATEDKASAILETMTVSTQEEQNDYELLKQLQAAMSEEINRVEDECIEAGMSDEEIDKACEKVRQKYLARLNMQPTATAPKAPVAPAKKPEKYVNYTEDFQYCVTNGSKYGYHFLICAEDQPQLKILRVKQELFRHKLSFRISAEDSGLIFGNHRAATLPNHTCLCTKDTETYTLRPFYHKGLTWEI